MTNKSAFDMFTISHLGIGIWAGQFFTPSQILIGMTIFEIAEREAKRMLPGLFPAPGQDSFINSFTDVFSAYLGAHLSRKVLQYEKSRNT